MGTLLEIFEVYLTEHKRLAKNTIESYMRDIRFLGNYLESIGIEDYTNASTIDILTYSIYLKKEGKSNATISRSIASIRTFYGYLHNNGYIDTNPALELESPKSERKIPNVLTLDQVDALMAKPDISTPKGIRDKAMLELLYATGIRVTELITLSLSDINISMGYIKCKSGNKSRVVPMGSLASRAVETYIRDSRPKMIKSNEETLFVNYFGKGMTRQGFWKIIKKYTNELDIDNTITPQTLRHSFALHLVQNGADIKSVQEMLGHSDASTTQIYMEMSNSKIKEVYSKAHPRA